MAGRRRKISRSMSTFKITNFECAVHSLRICKSRDVHSELVLSRTHFQEAEFQHHDLFFMCRRIKEWEKMRASQLRVLVQLLISLFEPRFGHHRSSDRDSVPTLV
jgi:hypothetical protein